jgi:SAM-dependent methyltransferase
VGRNAVWLAHRGWALTGVDFSHAGLEKARALATERRVHAEWIAADLLDYRPEPHGFDLVLLFYLQLPAEPRRQGVRTAAAGVAPGGTLLVVAHDRENLDHGHGGAQDLAVLYTAEDITGDLAGSGLHIDRADRVRRPVQTPDGERVALDALLRASRA